LKRASSIYFREKYANSTFLFIGRVRNTQNFTKNVKFLNFKPFGTSSRLSSRRSVFVYWPSLYLQGGLVGRSLSWLLIPLPPRSPIFAIALKRATRHPGVRDDSYRGFGPRLGISPSCPVTLLVKNGGAPPPYLPTALRVEHHPFGLSAVREHPQVSRTGSRPPPNGAVPPGVWRPIRHPLPAIEKASFPHGVAGPQPAEVLPPFGAWHRSRHPPFIGRPTTDFGEHLARRSPVPGHPWGVRNTPGAPGDLRAPPGASTPRFRRFQRRHNSTSMRN